LIEFFFFPKKNITLVDKLKSIALGLAFFFVFSFAAGSFSFATSFCLE